MLILQNRGCEDQIRTFALRLKQIKRSTKQKNNKKSDLSFFFNGWMSFIFYPGRSDPIFTLKTHRERL